MNDKDKPLKKEIIRFSRMLYDKGMVNAYEGNVSARRGKGMWVTPSAVCKGTLRPDMLVRLDLGGEVKYSRPPYRASSESKLHLAIYNMTERIGAVVHAHTPYATTFALRGKPIETRAYPEMMVLFDRVPILSYGTPSTEAVYAGLSDIIEDYDVFLLSNHGLVAMGPTVEEAYYRLESVEAMARVLYLVEMRGDTADLPDEEIERLRGMHQQMRDR